MVGGPPLKKGRDKKQRFVATIAARGARALPPR
jgi:hypothetical protein